MCVCLGPAAFRLPLCHLKSALLYLQSYGKAALLINVLSLVIYRGTERVEPSIRVPMWLSDGFHTPSTLRWLFEEQNEH